VAYCSFRLADQVEDIRSLVKTLNESKISIVSALKKEYAVGARQDAVEEERIVGNMSWEEREIRALAAEEELTGV